MWCMEIQLDHILSTLATTSQLHDILSLISARARASSARIRTDTMLTPSWFLSVKFARAHSIAPAGNSYSLNDTRQRNHISTILTHWQLTPSHSDTFTCTSGRTTTICAKSSSTRRSLATLGSALWLCACAASSRHSTDSAVQAHMINRFLGASSPQCRATAPAGDLTGSVSSVQCHGPSCAV